MTVFTIARAAREAGVNIAAVRFYEQKGLIEAQQIGFSLARSRNC